jgi:hypothetical protein
MATIDQETGTDRPRFCPACGQASRAANFCPGCGHDMGFAADDPVARSAAQNPPGGSRPGRVALIAVCAALGIAAVAVAVVILLSGGGGSKPVSAGISYRQQLAKVFAPVIIANQTLSGALTAVDGSRPSIRAAKTDTSQALAALAAARGGVAVLTVPSSDSTLSGQVQQVLTTETGYLQAVSSTLATPSGPSTGQLQTLATGAQSALDNLDRINSGSGTSLDGTGNLVSWAQGAAGAQKAHKAAPQHANSQTTATSTLTQTTTSPPAVTTSGGGATANGAVSCGGGLFAGPNTSCGFAANVQAAWESNPGPTATATSPATGQTYTESCTSQGSGAYCTGGIGNSVWWG